MTVRINSKPCDECGCYLVDDFKCGCGAVHEPYCQLCGRFPKATSPVNGQGMRCDKGPAPHHHASEEKLRFHQDAFERTKKQMKENPRKDGETVADYFDRLKSVNVA